MAVSAKVSKGGRPPRDHFLVDPLSGCHVWTGSMWSDRYACVRRGGRRHLAHRFYYEQRHGPIPEDLMLDHLCRVTICVNPDHMEPVTNAENQRRGDAARLDWDKARFIRDNYIARHPELGMRALGRRFGVTHEAVRKIINGSAWVEPQAS